MKRGFTFVEILISIAILVLLSTLVLASIRMYVQRQALSGAVASVAAVINDARTQTLSGSGGVQHGVYFEADSVTLFAGASYDQDDPENEVTLLDPRVIITDISVSAGNDVVFEKLTGSTNDAGTVTLSLTADASVERVITIQSTGLISYD